MTRYNPYFFQSLAAPLVQQRPRLLLWLLGGSARLALDPSAWVSAPPGCETRLEELVRAARLGVYTRRDAETIVLLLLWSDEGLRARLSRLAGSRDCGALDALLREKLRVYPQLVNDMRRGYVILVEGDEEACMEWGRGGASARLSTLARVAVGEAEGLSHEAVGAVIVLLGTLLRVTPAYHLLAVAVTLASRLAGRPCSVERRGLASMLAGSIVAERLAGIVATRSTQPAQRVAELLAASIDALCEAVKVLQSDERARRALQGTVLKFDSIAEILDANIYLDSVEALGVPEERLEDELEECIGRCRA